jgi:Cu-Zn family superoxide dismutase
LESKEATMRRLIVTAGFAALALASCAGGDSMSSRSAVAATATLRDNGGNVRATATLAQVGDDIRVSLTATGMAPGIYGAHLHAVGRCDPPDFASAGPHWNPAMRQHGKDNPQGMHKGDLPNLNVGTDGRGSLEFMVAGASVAAGSTPLLDADGAAVVIHASADDYRTDPSGNSGARIACGVFG